MKRGQIISKSAVMLLALGLFLILTATLTAQVQTSTTTTHQPATREVKVERGEVVYVSGNHLIIKMDNGEIRDIPNVPESATVTVDGREVGIRDVKVGMKLEKTITTTTTPRMVTKVETVTGKVFHVIPPNSVILTMENGENQRFNIPRDQKFNVDGQMTDAWGLKKGMTITATRVTETPETHVAVEEMISGKLPPPPPPPPEAPVLIVYLPAAHPAPVPAPAPGEATEAPKTLPKTASNLPLIGLLGMLMLSVGLGLRAAERVR
jgi:hypothetical protein